MLRPYDPGTPTAATRISARRVYRGQSATPVCTTVTAAFAVGRFCANNIANGRPNVAPRPSTTTSRPATGTPWNANNASIPAGVHGNGPGNPNANRPMFTGCIPSTSESGSNTCNARS